MKKILLVFIIAAQCICVMACVNNKKIGNVDYINDNMVDKREAIVSLSSISVFFEEGTYSVVVEQDGKTQKSVELYYKFVGR